jgi:enoyl-CoA hydratase
MSTDTVRYELRDDVALITLDDGKANALPPAVLAAISAAFDRAEGEAKAVVLTGRPGRFSGGFDLGVLMQGRESIIGLVSAGAELACRIYGFPRPVVAACSGHAIAMGVFLILACDYRLGVRGDFKLQMNEVQKGIVVPRFAIELSRDRLSKRHLSRATVTSEAYTPEGAVDAGILDALTSPERLLDDARAVAARYAALDTGPIAGTKRRLRGGTIELIRRTLREDMELAASGT